MHENSFLTVADSKRQCNAWLAERFIPFELFSLYASVRNPAKVWISPFFLKLLQAPKSSGTFCVQRNIIARQFHSATTTTSTTYKTTENPKYTYFDHPDVVRKGPSRLLSRLLSLTIFPPPSQFHYTQHSIPPAKTERRQHHKSTLSTLQLIFLGTCCKSYLPPASHSSQVFISSNPCQHD